MRQLQTLQKGAMQRAQQRFLLAVLLVSLLVLAIQSAQVRAGLRQLSLENTPDNLLVPRISAHQKYHLSPSVTDPIPLHPSPRRLRGSGARIEALRANRPRIRAFIGVHTGFAKKGLANNVYQDRRMGHRGTWFPTSAAEQRRWLKDYGLVVRFVIGYSTVEDSNAALKKEQDKYHDFLQLDIEEGYNNLALKTRAYFYEAAQQYDADWYIKMDDDVYLPNVERLMAVMRHWDSNTAQYVGCLIKNSGVVSNPEERFYQPAHDVIGSKYYWLYAWGPFYALSKQAIQSVVLPNYDTLRTLYAAEDGSVGLWMLAHGVDPFHDGRLCEANCTEAAVAVTGTWEENRTAGDLKRLHADPTCRSQPLL